MKLEICSDREAMLTQTFDAPRGRVFEAFTQPARLARWYGPPGMTLVVCEIALHVGGSWRLVLRAPDGREHGFTGVYRAIEPGRIVRTERYEAFGPELVATMTFDETDGRTAVSIALTYPSLADRDGHLASGVVDGMTASFARLDALLAGLA